MNFKALLGGVLAVLVLAAGLLAPGLADAASKVRIEWVQTTGDSPSVFYGEQTLTVTGSTPAPSNGAPAMKYTGGFARLTVISGAVIAAWGPSPTAGETNGLRLQAGDKIYVYVNPGDVVTFVEAADQPSAGGGGGAVTGANGAFVDGWNVTGGSTTDAACAGSTFACSVEARLAHAEALLNTISTSVQGAIAAQSSHGVNIGGVEGVSASGASDADNPLNSGGRAATATPTAVTDGQKVAQQMTVGGKAVVQPWAIPENLVQGVTAAMTGTTSTQILPAPATGLRNYAWVSCGNSHATVGTFVTVQDGSGGTAIGNITAAPAYGGELDSMPTPIRQPTTATALFVADVTTGANVICKTRGYVAP